MNNADGYNGSGTFEENDFDNFIRNEIQGDYSIWSANPGGGNSNTVYDLSNLITDAGGAFTGNTNGGGGDPYAGPIAYWSYAPQAKVSVPAGQVITPGSTFNFDGEAALQTYHATHHWEYVEVDGPNGTKVAGVTVNFANANWGYGSGVNGPVYADLQQGDLGAQDEEMTEVNGGTNTPVSSKPVWDYWADGTGETGWGNVTIPAYKKGQSSNAADTITLPADAAPGTYTIKFQVADYYNRVSNVATTTFQVGNGGSNSGITLTASSTTPTTGTPVTLTATVQTPPPSGGSVADIFCLGMKSF